jgi:hypothetical protein
MQYDDNGKILPIRMTQVPDASQKN